MSNCCIYSPQEQKIMDRNHGNLEYRKGRERIYKIVDRFQGMTPAIDIERGLYFTESMKKTEGKDLVLRWALAMKHIAENITVYIDDDNLLAGRGGAPVRYGILYPEICGDIMENTLQDIVERDASSFEIAEDDIKILREQVAPYWKGQAFTGHFIEALPEETKRITFDPNFPGTARGRNIVNESVTQRGSLQWVPDYEKGIKKGFRALQREAQERLDAMDPAEFALYDEKRQYLEAMVTICEAIIIWGRRHADKAWKLAAAEKDEKRKKELLEIAERCAQVPEFPARNFAEAVQAHWFIALFHRLEFSTGGMVSNGRMDQFLYPYYKQDVETGILTERQAMELLECLWVSMAQCMDLKFTAGSLWEGYAHWEAVTIGGQTRDGQDATNDLTYLMLRSKQEFSLDYPDLAARIHARSPEKYLREVAKTIREGSGYPKLFNDEEIIPLLLSKGAPMEDAFDYALSGCTEARMPNVDTFTTAGSFVSLAAPLEMVLYNGKTYSTGDEIIGLQTGEPEALDSWEKFWQAYTSQVDVLMQHMLAQFYHAIRLRSQHFASPLSSCLHNLCMEQCIDLHDPRVSGGLDLANFDVLGFGTVTDSLAAIKKLVYDEKKVTLSEVVKALQMNFEGFEILRQRMLNAPKYGNNDEYADSIGKDVEALCNKWAKIGSDLLHIHIDTRMVPITAHVAFGGTTGATPDGRKAGFSLSDGSSAAQGADMEGPTAVLVSNANTKNYTNNQRASRLLNIKFQPSFLADEEGISKMVDFIRTWCNLKLWMVQFNVINRETLLKAQENPEQYKSLMVRVAGYSAYFTSLTPGLQEDIIARTGHDSM